MPGTCRRAAGSPAYVCAGAVADEVIPLHVPTPGLADYLACVGDDTDWGEFRSHDSGASYSELRDTLTENQHGLCAYCEVALGDRHRQVEHVIPRSDVRLGKAKALDIANMVASCMGGTLEVRSANEDEALYREPVARNMSCGQAKGERHDECFLDPRMLPATPPLARVSESGATPTTGCRTGGESRRYACVRRPDRICRARAASAAAIRDPVYTNCSGKSSSNSFP